ncbi:MAG: UbiA family prenyltransferase [Ignavibacteriales bacterium]|nr:UbiA family prenyltransferase [Ignavibacteriales bacterium]
MSVSVITNQNKVNQNQEVLGSSNKYIQSIIEFKNILMELTKFRITFFVTVTTTVGFLLSSGKFNLDLLIVSLGVLVLASGASSLNEYQERNSDAKMERTKLRPIPAGRISENNALLVSIALIFLGSAILFVNGVTVLLLGIFTLIWYNGVYTNLKLKRHMQYYLDPWSVLFRQLLDGLLLVVIFLIAKF